MIESAAYELIKLEGVKEGIKEGLRQGITEGRIEEARELLIEALDVKFTPVPKQVAERIRRIDEVEKLRSLFRNAILCNSLDEFIELLDGSGEER